MAVAVVVEIVKYYSLLLYSYYYSQIVAAVVVEDATKYMNRENIPKHFTKNVKSDRINTMHKMGVVF